MPGTMKNKNRRFQFFYIAGMPAEICGGENELTAEQAVERIVEEWKGQRESILKSLNMNEREYIVRRGQSVQGQRFLIVCTS